MASYCSLFFHIPQLPHTSPPASTAQLRSFLSLDIADSVLSRSSTLRQRRDSSSSDSTSYSYFADSPLYQARPTPSRASSSSSASSSQRSLPRPKPAPRTTVLPAIPTPERTRRSRSTPRRPTRAVSPSPVPAVPIRPASIMTATSTVSTHYRRTKRTDALARLEGRSPPPPPTSPPPYSPHAAVHRTKSAAPVLATKSFMAFSADSDSDSDDEDFDAKDVRVELVPMPSSPETLTDRQLLAPPKRGRSRAGTIESWIVGAPTLSAPLAPKNFMEFDFDTDSKKTFSLGMF